MALADTHTDASSLLAGGLLRDRGLIGGEWVKADSGATFAVTNPATGEGIAQLPRMGAAETREAIEAARAALPAWRATPAADRARILRGWSELMTEHVEPLALLMTLEQGKPLAEARAEIAYAAAFFEWFAEEAKRIYGDMIPSPNPDNRIVVLKQPVGVTAGITPWNFPAAMPRARPRPALAAGCTMVLKPAEQTPLSALGAGRTGAARGRARRRVQRRHRRRRRRPGDRRRADRQPGRAQAQLHRLDGDRQAADAPGAPTRSRRSRWSSAATRRSSSSRTPTSTRRWPGRCLRSSATPGRCASAANRILVQESVADAFVEQARRGGDAARGRNGHRRRRRSIGPLIDEQARSTRSARHVEDAVPAGARAVARAASGTSSAARSSRPPC